MSAGTYLGLCLSLLAVCVSLGSAASDQQILGHPGMSVNLTFQVPTGTTSVWLKRLPNKKYICYCQDLTSTRPSDQEESFKGRVEGMDCSNISSTVSVTLKNLTRNDSGTYELQGVDHGGRYFNKTVFLNVTDPGETGLFTTLPPLGIPLGGRSKKVNGTINLKSFPYYRDCLFNMSYHGDIT
ncbi:CMRF35-like molecule 8 [Oreochromis aureus]|uniref:CMRF35-like molecule 8 n=1 Tax=Oreochromis aureus TaxID=47969 RepID=UPI001954BBED|nr:CMRF35-like molecule 8 [Oreochromis aureus]